MSAGFQSGQKRRNLPSGRPSAGGGNFHTLSHKESCRNAARDQALGRAGNKYCVASPLANTSASPSFSLSFNCFFFLGIAKPQTLAGGLDDALKSSQCKAGGLRISSILAPTSHLLLFAQAQAASSHRGTGDSLLPRTQNREALPRHELCPNLGRLMKKARF
jgi:hypothetical protein